MELAVQADGLRKRYGAKEALAGVDLEVPAGTVCGLLGPNGAGKTTIVRILATPLRPDGGSARVAGYDVVRDADRARFRIGLVANRRWTRCSSPWTADHPPTPVMSTVEVAR